MFRLLSDINNRQQDGFRLGETQIRKAFEMWWPDLREALVEIENEGPAESPPERPVNVVLEELLELTSGLQREIRTLSDKQAQMLDKVSSEYGATVKRLLTARSFWERPWASSSPPDCPPPNLSNLQALANLGALDEMLIVNSAIADAAKAKLKKLDRIANDPASKPPEPEGGTEK